MATYNAQQTYEHQFNEWFGEWLNIYNFQDWYVSDQQKEKLYKLFQSSLEKVSSQSREISDEISIKMEIKRRQFLSSWLTEFRRKYDFSSTLLSSTYVKLLFQEFFKNNEREIENIADNIEADKVDLIRNIQKDEDALAFNDDVEYEYVLSLLDGDEHIKMVMMT